MSDSNQPFSYQEYLERAIEKLFVRDEDAEVFLQLLKKVSCPLGWRCRIGLAILKICGAEIDQISKFVESSYEHRDIVAMAEYPLQSGNWKLRNTDREQYDELVFQDWENYNIFIVSLKE